MEDISADDDLLSDILLDGLEFDPPISTHKMNQTYRSPRYETSFIMALLKQRVIVESDINAALDELSRLQTIQRHLLPKTERQAQAFYAHARRYLETYLPDSGVEFALTARYKRPHPTKLRADAEAAAAAAAAAAVQAAAGEASSSAKAANAPATVSGNKRKGKARATGEAAMPLNQPPGHPRADLCVVALRPYRAGEILLCKGGVKDLTRDEDVALREEAAASRDGRETGKYAGVLGPGRDFSIIRSARKGCSQLLLGPARFVNHDCKPNCEFYRVGQTQMAFKTLRPIALNEEITTYYGDNYFEWANSECLCATCEANGKGAFALPPDATAAAAVASASGVGDSGVATPTDAPAEEVANGRRTSGRRSIPTRRADPSPSLPPESPAPPTTGPGSEASSSSRASTRSFTHHISDREAFPYLDNAAPRGPRCTCLTCGAPHWAPETWWVPDECRRCERHFRIYKADWPSRKPAEPYSGLKELKAYTGKPMLKGRTKRGAEPVEAESGEPVELAASSSSKRRAKAAKGPAKSLVARRATDETGSERSTPIKLSPLRDARPPDPGGEGRRKSTRRTRSSASAPPEDVKDQPRLAGALDIDSELSDPESSDMNEDGDATLTTLNEKSRSDLAKETEADSVSSSDSDKPSAPKMLGPQARTEALAYFWGATGDRRQRRQSSGAPERLARPSTASMRGKDARIGTRRGSTRLRSASGASSQSHSIPSRFANVQDDDEEVEEEEDELPKRSHKKKRVELANSDNEAVDDEPAAAAQQQQLKRSHRKKMILPSNVASSSEANGHEAGPARRSSLPAPPEAQQSKEGPASGSSSPASGVPLATQGAERTSVKNLAAFWSAGVEDGAGRTRRQVHREPTTLMPAPDRIVPAKRSRLSVKNGASSGESRSATPEVKRPRGSGGVTGRGPPKVRMSDGAQSEGGGSGGSNNGKRYDDMDVDEASERAGGAQAGSSHGWPGAMPSSGKTALAARLSGGSSTSTTGFPRPASASPLAGPVDLAASVPKRKNLRWGRPKSSTSRPIPGASGSTPGGTSTTARPAPSPGAPTPASGSGVMLNLGTKAPYDAAKAPPSSSGLSPSYARPSSPLTKLSSFPSSDDTQFKVPASPVATFPTLPAASQHIASTSAPPHAPTSSTSSSAPPSQSQAEQLVKVENHGRSAQQVDLQLAPAPSALAAMPLSDASPEPLAALHLAASEPTKLLAPAPALESAETGAPVSQPQVTEPAAASAILPVAEPSAAP